MDIERIEEWIGREVVDTEGDKVGKLGEVFYRGEEAIVGEIRSGLIAKKSYLVPLTEASAGRDYLRVPFTKGQIEAAPPGDGELSAADVTAVATAYGTDLGPAEDLESTSARQARQEAAAAALARAEAAEAEAQRLASAAEEAVAHARDADRAADDAIAARDKAERAAKEARADVPAGARSLA